MSNSTTGQSIDVTASRGEKICACVGLIVFGVAVGIVAVLSEKSGTAVTLLGLLFALLGGSLVSLFANSKLSEQTRCQLGVAVGLISLGLLVGMGIAFKLKLSETAGLPNASDDFKRIFVIHADYKDQVGKLSQAGKTVLDDLPREDPNRAKFEHLLNFLEYVQSAESKFDNLEELAKKNENKYDKDGFSAKLRDLRAGLKNAK